MSNNTFVSHQLENDFILKILAYIRAECQPIDQPDIPDATVTCDDEWFRQTANLTSAHLSSH